MVMDKISNRASNDAAAPAAACGCPVAGSESVVAAAWLDVSSGCHTKHSNWQAVWGHRPSNKQKKSVFDMAPASVVGVVVVAFTTGSSKPRVESSKLGVFANWSSN